MSKPTETTVEAKNYTHLCEQIERAMARLYGDEGILAVRAYQILRDALPEYRRRYTSPHPKDRE